MVTLASAVWSGCESHQPNAPERAPATVEEFFKALDSGLSAETGLFHLQLTYDQTEHGQTQSWGTVEAWVDASNERARWEFTKSGDNQADIAGHTVSIYTPPVRCIG